jgi:hypothetical protein
MNALIDDAISNVVLSPKPCSRLLENDGISTRFFLLRDFDNKKKLIYFKDVTVLRSNVPKAGLAITIVKNFDEYQHIICNYIPKLNDNNFYKIKFQKIRILIYLFFHSISKILTDANDPNVLDDWIKESNSLLKETSELILDYRESSNNSNNNSVESLNKILTQKVKLKQDYFNYFNMAEEKIDRILYSIYGIEI